MIFQQFVVAWYNQFEILLTDYGQWTSIINYLVVHSDKTEKDAFERSTEVQVEDGVDNGVQCRVDVAQPDWWGEYERWDVTLWTSLSQLIADTNGVDDVDCEERSPTHEKHTCTRTCAHTKHITLIRIIIN